MKPIGQASLKELHAILSEFAQAVSKELEEPAPKKGKKKRKAKPRPDLSYLKKYRAVLLSLAEIVLAWSSLEAADQCTWGVTAMRLVLEGKINAVLVARHLPEIGESAAQSMDAMSTVFQSLVEQIPAHNHNPDGRNVH